MGVSPCIPSEGSEAEMLIVPCISRMARPEGVWSSRGRGFGGGEGGREEGDGWRGIDGMGFLVAGRDHLDVFSL